MSDAGDFRNLATVFNVVFLTAVGSLSQLTTVFFAAETPGSRAIVFIGSAAALVAAAALGVLAGAWIGQHLSPRVFHGLAGVVLVVTGLWSLRTALF